MSSHQITNIPSPLSTGGVGYTFEHKVQAYYLLKLIEGGESRLGKLIQLQFQARYEGVKTDDLICTYDRDGAVVRVFIQCKINLGVSESNREFRSVILNAWEDYSHGVSDPDYAYRHGTDFLALIYDTDASVQNMKTMRTLIQLAKASCSMADFAKKCTSKQSLVLLDVIARIVQPSQSVCSSAAFLWDFLRALKWSPFQFDGNTPVHEDEIFGVIKRLTGNLGEARLIWSALVQEAARLNGNAATVNASNLAMVLDSAVLVPLKGANFLPRYKSQLVSFPWATPIWAAQHLQKNSSPIEDWGRIGADEILLDLRAKRTARWLASDLVMQDFQMFARTIATNLDQLNGSFDDKAALALFIALNVPDEDIQRRLVHWSVNHASGPFVQGTSDVEYTFRGLYLHYHGHDASDSPRLAKLVMSAYSHGRGISTWKHTPHSLIFWNWGYLFNDNAPPPPEDVSVDNFCTMRWAIADGYPDYRRPEEDSCAVPGLAGVASFEALIRAVRSGCIDQVLTRYHLCTSEPTFERLLNVYAELDAHVRRKIRYISANDVYILREMEKLLGNSIASEVTGYVDNKLVVLPVQEHFPLINEEVINRPFTNFSLCTKLEEHARNEHAATLNYYSSRDQHINPRQLWGSNTIFAEVMLAMTLKTRMFANSQREAELANTHGVGVSKLDMCALFNE